LNLASTFPLTSGSSWFIFIIYLISLVVHKTNGWASLFLFFSFSPYSHNGLYCNEIDGWLLDNNSHHDYSTTKWRSSDSVISEKEKWGQISRPLQMNEWRSVLVDIIKRICMELKSQNSETIYVDHILLCLHLFI
jgi:hypothetical protein